MGKQSHLVPQYGMTIPATWAVTTLGELCGINGGTVQTGPFGSQLHQHDYKPTGTPVVMPTQLGDNQIDTDEIARISDEDRDRLSRHILQVGDIVFSRRGDVTRRAYITRKEAGWLCGTGCMLIRARHPSLDSKYLSLFFSLPIFKKYIVGQAVGATMPNLNTGILEAIPVFFSPLLEQQRIVGILSAYDDLIENNRRRIEILGEMARRIYREWFVEFRFPGHENVKFVDSPLGKIPEGWEVRTVRQVVKRLKTGNTYRGKTVMIDGQVPVVDQSRDDILGYHNNDPDHRATPERPIIVFGDHTCKMRLMIESFSLGPNVVPFVSADATKPMSYVYFLVRDLVHTQEYKRHWTDLSNKEVVVGNDHLPESFARFAALTFRFINCLEKRNRNLQKTRDLLLPRLISGELDVSDLPIDCGVEDANGA